MSNLFESWLSHKDCPIPHLVASELHNRLRNALLTKWECLSQWLDTMSGTKLKHFVVDAARSNKARLDIIAVEEHLKRTIPVVSQ